MRIKIADKKIKDLECEWKQSRRRMVAILDAEGWRILLDGWKNVLVRLRMKK